MLPKDWRTSELQNGIVSVQIGSARWVGAAVCVVFAVLFFFVFNWFYLPTLLCLYLAFHSAFYREEWRVDKNLLQIRKSFCRYTFVKTYTQGKFEIQRWDIKDGDGERCCEWHLELITDERWIRLGFDATKTEHETDIDYHYYPPELMGLGTFLSERTGWPLTPQVK